MTTPDFPYSPTLGQRYTTPSGIVYEWNGSAWTIGFYDSADQTLTTVGDILGQIRTLLQDTDNLSGQYRYSTDSIITNINQGLVDMFRVRPDIFLENGFKIPVFNATLLDTAIVIEEQFVPSLVYYAVGLTQARDDEQNQDARAAAFIQTFLKSLVSVG